MADDATTNTEAAAETSGDSTEATATEATTPTEPEAATDGEQALGDAGKKALDAMKAERKAAREEAAAAKAERDALQAKLDGKEAEFTAAQERAAVEAAALAKANDRIKRSEVKAAAKGVLADPQDAYKFLELDSFEVSEDGDVDTDAINAALSDLVKQKPYLGAQGGQRFTADVDGGARKVTPPASIDEQITELQKAGNHKAAQSLKASQLLELRNNIT